MFDPSTLSRFWSKVDRGDASECWQWRGTHQGGGYGTFAVNPKRNMRAHRFAYEAERGSIPKGLVIDHLCRNRGCVNPAHLEPVTPRENTLRGFGPTATNSRKTHCVHGHELDGANLHVLPNGVRVCRTCRAVASKRNVLRYRERNPVIIYPPRPAKATVLARRFAERRAALGMTQKDASRATGGFVSDKTIASIERGRVARPSPERLSALADACRLPVSVLEAWVNGEDLDYDGE